MNYSLESGDKSLALQSAEETDRPFCIICFTKQNNNEFEGDSLQKKQSIKQLTTSLDGNLISLHSFNEQPQPLRIFLKKISNQESLGHNQKQNSYQDKDNFRKVYEEQFRNICLNCIDKAEKQLKNLKQESKEKRINRLVIEDETGKERKSRSTNPKLAFKTNKSFFVKDDENSYESSNISDNQKYLSQVLYASKMKKQSQQSQQLSSLGKSKKSSKMSKIADIISNQYNLNEGILDLESKVDQLGDFLALESKSEKETVKKHAYGPQFNKKVVIQGFPAHEKKRNANLHRSTETYIEKVKIFIDNEKQSNVVCCTNCGLQLQQKYALPCSLKPNQWFCRICFTLHESKAKLISFDGQRDGKAVSRSKRAESMNRIPRSNRQNIGLFPYQRTNRATTQNQCKVQQQNYQNQCGSCQSKGGTLVKYKDKNYCIYCYYNNQLR